MPSFFRFVGALKAGRAAASRGQQVFLNWRQRGGDSAAAADIFQPRIHQRILGADRIHTGRGIGFRRWCRTQRRLCGCGRCSRRCNPVVAGQSSTGIRDRFALRGLGDGGLGQRANRDEYGRESHFNPFFGQWNQAMKRSRSRSDDRTKSRGLPICLARTLASPGRGQFPHCADGRKAAPGTLISRFCRTRSHCGRKPA